MKSRFLLAITLFVSFSIVVFGQLDTVYYQGPSQGSVSSGAMQNTENFPTNVTIISSGEPRAIPNVDTRIHSEPMIENYDMSNVTTCVYVEDTNAGNNENPNLGSGNGSVLLNKFPGYPATNAIPPDPSMAVGPNYIVATVNGFPSFFRIFDKQGNVLKTINVATWYSPVSPDETGDGQVIYDNFAGRWVINYMQVNDVNQTAANLVAYSDDDDPNGVWYVYRFDTKKHGTVQTNTWGDYPQLGFDDEAIYISTRVYGFAGGWYGMKVRVISKAVLYNSNGGAVTWWDFWDIRGPNLNNPPAGAQLDGIHPTFSYTTGQGGYLFYAYSNSTDKYVLYKILNPTSNTPRLRAKQMTGSLYYSAPNANQLGGGTALESGGSVCRTAPIIKDGKLFATHAVGNYNYPPNLYCSAKYVIVDLNSTTILEESELGAEGYYYIYPTIAVDESNNIAVTFTRSADTEYAGAYYSTKLAGDPPGLDPSTPIQEGLSNYQHVSQGRNRWGDYMAIYLDPSNNHDFFMHTEYAAANNSWATIIGHVIASPYQGVYAYPIPAAYDFAEVETGTTSQTGEIILSNYGRDDLVITDIPANFGDFNLETTLSFPITLSTYDSLTLEFSFTPTVAGQATVTYPMTTNDPDFSGVELSGMGYDVALVAEKTIYASSGLQNNGNLLTIDPMTGAGTVVGSSLFDEVTSISINPLDGKLYGIIAGSSTAELLKINSGSGDAHHMFTLNIPLMAGIAFDTTGVLYGITRTGDLYTINTSDGSTSFVVDAIGSYLGITFNPQTNELWATSRQPVGLNMDAIFKVNILTGDTTIVGHTALGKQTNDIVFDENVNLYGVIGSSSELNDFVSINTSDGTGTIIGSVGMKHILGLAYLDKLVTDVKEDKNIEAIPSDYVLKQNYPNPFNPSTTINYSIPAVSDVKLIIYNVLGQEVITLIDDQKTAGNYSVFWNATDAGGNQLTSGIYFYKLVANGISGEKFQDIKKMILIK